MIRFVCGPDAVAVPDLRATLPGRGGYLCPRWSCLRKGLKPRGIPRSLGCGSPVDPPEVVGKKICAGLERLIKERIGHAHRAGHVCWGMDRVKEAIGAGVTDWVLVAADAANRTQHEIGHYVEQEGVVTAPNKVELGSILDRAEVGVVAITQPKLGNDIRALAVRWNRLIEENGDGQG